MSIRQEMSAPTGLRLEAGSDRIDVWRISLDLPSSEIAGLREILAPDEIKRADRFYFPIHRSRFIVGRGTLRTILAAYLQTIPERLLFAYNEYDRPSLAGEYADALRFNLSHSGGEALLAVTHYREVGVDIEEYDPKKGDEAVAENYFSPSEVACFRAVPAPLKPRAFLNCWTRKESYIKAQGMGLSIPLDSFDVTLKPGVPAQLLRVAEPGELQRWRLRELDLGDAYVGALTAEGQDWNFLLRRWPSEAGAHDYTR